MNLRFPKLTKANLYFVIVLIFTFQIEAKSQNNPQITCPEEQVINICAPISMPAKYLLEDFSPSDDNTPAAEIDFNVAETVDRQTDFTTVTHLYTFTDKDGNSSTCEMVFNILHYFLRAPEIPEQRQICQNNFFPGVKLGAKNYRIYADDNGSQGELIGLCDDPNPLCLAEKLGVDGLTVATNQVWISHFVTFPNGFICESALSPLQIDVLAKPEASLSASTITLLPNEVINLMDLVEENSTGYWTGSHISSFATVEGSTTWTFSAPETGLVKLFYTVQNEACSQSYSLIADIIIPPEPEPDIDVDYAADSEFDTSFIEDSGGTTTPPSGETPETQPDAGLVTAAEWNDLDNWEFLDTLLNELDTVFNNVDTLLNENNYSEMPDYWGFYPEYRVAVFVKNDDNLLPAIDATIELSYNNEVKWVAKTDNEGRAELWPSLYQNDTIDVSNLSLAVNGEPVSSSVLLYEEGINEVTINRRPINLNQVELSFIVDATGSMTDELEFLKQDLRDVITTVEDTTSNLNIRTSTVFYRDEGDEYVIRQSDFTDDIDVTIAFIQNQAAGGGGDFPEAVHTALDACVNNLQWSANAKARIAFLLLDAPPHYTPRVILDIQNTIKTAAAKGIKIIPITASGIDKETEFLMRFMAMATNGTYTFITNDSGIGNDHIEPSVGDFDVEYLNNLLVRLILQYTN